MRGSRHFDRINGTKRKSTPRPSRRTACVTLVSRRVGLPAASGRALYRKVDAFHITRRRVERDVVIGERGKPKSSRLPPSVPVVTAFPHPARACDRPPFPPSLQSLRRRYQQGSFSIQRGSNKERPTPASRTAVLACGADVVSRRCDELLAAFLHACGSRTRWAGWLRARVPS